MSESQTLVAFLATLIAIVTLVALGATISMGGHSVETIGIGAAVTGLIAVATTFRATRVAVPIVDPVVTAAGTAAVVAAVAGATGGSGSGGGGGPFISKLSDYAEAIKRAPGCMPLAAGAIIGINDDGELTSIYGRAHSFAVVSTHAGFIGGVDPAGDPNEREIVAFVGQVPVNILNGVCGQYVDATIGNNDTIVGILSTVAGPFTVGRIWKLEGDGRAWIKLI